MSAGYIKNESRITQWGERKALAYEIKVLTFFWYLDIACHAVHTSEKCQPTNWHTCSHFITHMWKNGNIDINIIYRILLSISRGKRTFSVQFYTQNSLELIFVDVDEPITIVVDIWSYYHFSSWKLYCAIRYSAINKSIISQPSAVVKSVKIILAISVDSIDR